MGGRDKKNELKRESLEPKWHWSVRYCCNFLRSEHGYKQKSFSFFYFGIQIGIGIGIGIEVGMT